MYRTCNKFFRSRIYLILFFILFRIVVSANDKMGVIYYTDKEGLPRNIVKSFINDEYGYGWVGTGNGIARFDGYRFVSYESLKGRNINNIVIDDKNRVWVGSDLGLYLYNRLNDSFSLIEEGYIKDLYFFDNNIYYSLPNRLVKLNTDFTTTEYEIENINSFTVTKDGVWVNRGNKGVRLMGRTTGFLDGRVVSLIKEIDGNLWVACRNGSVFMIDNQKSIHKVQIKNRHSVMDIEKIGNQIWLSTDGNGIIILDEDFNIFNHLKKEQRNVSILASNSIYDVSPGMNGAIWVSTYGAGLICLLPANNAFVNFIPNRQNSNSLVDKEGVSVFVDENSYLLGTNYGFSIWKKSSNTFLNVDSDKLKKQVNGSKVTAITSTEKNIWVATYDGLMARYSKELKLQEIYHPCTEEANEMQRIVLFYKLNENTILVGTHYKSNSLFKFDINRGQFTHVQLTFREQNKLNFQINSIRKNQFGEIIGLIRNVGIFIYNAEKNSLDNFVPEINTRITFKLNDFYHDKNGDYWFTTQADGLIRLSPDGKLFDKWTTEQGFPTNSLLRIESVDDHVLWISTIEGLCRFDMRNEQIQVFSFRHGLASNEFLPRASTVTPDKKIIFGNSEGFTIIDPEKFIADSSKLEVIISDINFQNQSIKGLDSEKYLELPIEETKEINLPYRRNSFTISFFTRDDFLPKYNNFEYRLIGLEENWIYLGTNNETTYTNLSPGKYFFQVRSTNKSNVWNETPTILKIQILPPWYLTWIAFVLYFIFIVTILLFVFRIYANRVQLKKEIEISEFKVKSEHELTEKKLAFFTNISHDLKTPLTLINMPVHDLLQSEKLDDEQRNKLEVIRRNSKRLYKLIADLIDFRKLTQKQLPLLVIQTDINEIIENVYKAFKEECRNKSIDFEYYSRVINTAFVDAKKIEKILWNLLSNAIKFTDSDGQIFLSVEEIMQNERIFLRFLVKDSGRGILRKDIEKIFNRFYQADINSNTPNEGTGIGLSIVKDLVELHHGIIEVESDPGIGSSFVVTIPAEKRYYSAHEIDNRESTQPLNSNPDIYQGISGNISDKTENEKYSLPKILLVEDNVELREYLAGHFSKIYKVYEAENGEKGYKCAKEKNPDIIVTDIMMPIMNGFEFCKKVRNNFEISHIPVIMLTANSAVEKQIEGLSTGADAYVTKPFDIELLDSVLNSVLLNRKMLREKFLGIEPLNNHENKLTKKDNIFIKDLKLYIEENIANHALNIDLLSRHFAVSRTQLNRKTKSLVGQTPNSLIRSIRLKKAYNLIRNDGVRVSEAAYSTGFTDPNYFTVCFKKEFGENPSRIN